LERKTRPLLPKPGAFRANLIVKGGGGRIPVSEKGNDHTKDFTGRATGGRGNTPKKKNNELVFHHGIPYRG